jgi:glycosyltransferase involved in cell wall biosynthesis
MHAAPEYIVSMPTVSVILPTFNRVEFLRLAVESVYSQTYSDWEMIIADDGSNEETRAYLRSITGPQIRTILLPHSGNPSKVRNAAIAASSGRYLAFLDSDDIWAPSKLNNQIEALRDRVACRWSYTDCNLIDERGHPVINERFQRFTIQDGWILEPLLKLEISIAMPSVVAARDLIDMAGGFDENQLFGEWQDLVLRLAMKSEVVALRESMCSVRIHGEQYSRDQVAATMGWMRLYEKMAGLIPTPQLQTFCAQMRAQTSLKVARLLGAKGDYRGVWTTLGRASMFSCRYPQWWWGALKAVARPAVPDVLMTALRRRG